MQISQFAPLDSFEAWAVRRFLLHFEPSGMKEQWGASVLLGLGSDGIRQFSVLAAPRYGVAPSAMHGHGILGCGSPVLEMVGVSIAAALSLPYT